MKKLERMGNLIYAYGVERFGVVEGKQATTPTKVPIGKSTPGTPFKFVKGLFTKEKSGSLSVSKADLEEHLKNSCTDDRHQKEVTLPSDMPVNPPEHELDISPPRRSEVDQTVHRARAASSQV